MDVFQELVVLRDSLLPTLRTTFAHPVSILVVAHSEDDLAVWRTKMQEMGLDSGVTGGCTLYVEYKTPNQLEKTLRGRTRVMFIMDRVAGQIPNDVYDTVVRSLLTMSRAVKRPVYSLIIST